MKSQRKLLIVMLILLAKFTFAQKETKFYWNEKWESVSKKENPSYYSLISLGDNDVPLSELKTYYLSGELYESATIMEFNRYHLDSCIIEGTLKNYYRNGNLRYEGEFANKNKRNGTFKYYYENGNISGIENYKNDILIGYKKIYNEFGKIKQLENYLNGVLNGEMIEYYESGNIRFSSYYKNGKHDGAMIYYFENGNKERIISFIDGIENGLRHVFYENGKLKTEGNCLNGKYHGKYIEYDENGNKKSEKNYNNGNLEYRTDGIYVFNCLELFEYISAKDTKPRDGNNYLAIQFNLDGTKIFYYNCKGSYIHAFDDKNSLIKRVLECNNGEPFCCTRKNEFVHIHGAYNWDYTRKNLFNLIDDKVKYESFFIYNNNTIESTHTSIYELEFIPLFELSSQGIAKKDEDAKIKKAKEEEDAKKYQLKKEEDEKQAILFEENRKTKLKNLQIGDRVSWSQGWKNTDKFFGFTFSETNYNMNVICYIENVSGDRYQIRVANIKSTSSSNWEYPELNGVPLKEGTLHWIKPSDYINDKSWHYME